MVSPIEIHWKLDVFILKNILNAYLITLYLHISITSPRKVLKKDCWLWLSSKLYNYTIIVLEKTTLDLIKKYAETKTRGKMLKLLNVSYSIIWKILKVRELYLYHIQVHLLHDFLQRVVMCVNSLNDCTKSPILSTHFVQWWSKTFLFKRNYYKEPP